MVQLAKSIIYNVQILNLFFVFQYSTWTLMYLGWNIFMICLYLEVGILNRVCMTFLSTPI